VKLKNGESQMQNENDIKKVDEIKIDDFKGNRGETVQRNYKGYIFTVYYYENPSRMGNVGIADVKKKGVQRQYVHYGWPFAELEQAVPYFENSIKDIQAVLDRREEKKRARAEVKKKGNPFKVGQILYNSWGYEQTNIDYFQIVRVTDASVFIREIGRDFEGTGWLQGKSKPKKDNFVSDEVLRKTVIYDTYGAHIRADAGGGYLSPTTEEETHYESNYH